MGEPDVEFRSLVEHFPGIVFLYEDRDGLRYTFVDGEGIEDIGLTREDLRDRRVAADRPPDVRDTMREKYRQALDGERVTFETSVEGRHFRITLFPVTDDAGTVERGAGIVEDVTERAVYARELERQNQRLERVTRLVSHDLRNPLNVVDGRLDMLAAECDSDQIEPIQSAVERMESLVEDLLSGEYDRRDEALESVGLRSTAVDAWDNVATKDADLRIDGDATFPADEDDLRRLFENLFRNAVEHGGDDVTVRVGTLADGFYVEDDGRGIPAAEREAVFDHGYSAAGDGSGLGLFIVRNVVDSHGWSIDLAESDDGGARFEITGLE